MDRIRDSVMMFWRAREARLRWFGLVPRRDSEYFSARMLRLEPADWRSGLRAKRRFMDVVNEDRK